MSDRPLSKHLRAIQTALINIAAQMVRGEGVPDWSDHKFYRTTSNGERREIMAALRDADEALRCYGVRLKEIADKVSSEIEWAKLSGDSSAPETSPDFRGLLEEMWKFWGRPREQEFIDAGVSVALGMDLYCRVSAALGDPVCADCNRRFSQHKTVISHDFRHRPSAVETSTPVVQMTELMRAASQPLKATAIDNASTPWPEKAPCGRDVDGYLCGCTLPADHEGMCQVIVPFGGFK